MAMDPFNTKQLNYRSYINTVRSLYDRPATQTSLALILTLITIIFFGLAAIRPTFTTVSKLEAELKEKREIESQMQNKLTSIAKVQDEYFDNQELLNVYHRAIPPQIDLEKTLVTIEYIAAQNPANLRGMQVFETQTYGTPPKEKNRSDSEIAPGPYPTFEVRMSVDGSYEDLTDFLQKISTIDRYIQISSISFNQPTEENSPYELNMGVRVNIFWDDSVKEPNSVGGAS